jgi:hypothetical protein
MRRITNYIIIREPTRWQFEDVMRENIELGWQPYGSLCYQVTPFLDGSGYREELIQPMVKYDGDK